MDRNALRVANALVGNAEGAAGLEITLIGPTLRFDRTALIAITGADLEATVNETRIPTWHPVAVPAGATLRFGKPQVGCRAYLAIAGGVDVPPLFGSRSTYLRGGFGGFAGRALRAGDVVPCGEASGLSLAIGQSLHAVDGIGIARWSAGATLRPPYSSEPLIRVLAGAHTDALARESRAALFTAPFRVSASSDRMGYRLEGPALSLREPLELLSEAVAFGTIQLPAGGAPIVLMADRQTTGGYPRVGEVASIDLPLIAQLKPGDRLRFRLVSLDEAQRWYLAYEQELTQARAGIALRFSRGLS
jgi:antagonist of KipI